jgi:DNA-binding response OmpR family regulator
VVDVLVCRVRNKIEKGFDKKLIGTLRGMRYVFEGGWVLIVRPEEIADT